MGSLAEAPCTPYYYVKVRLTKFSPKQKGETYKNATGGRLKEGDLASRTFPLGTKIQMPDGNIGIVKDRTSKWAHRKFNGKLVDECLIQSIKSKPKSRAVNRELMRHDEGWNYIKVYRQ
jgi:uncharacterized protein YwbE